MDDTYDSDLRSPATIQLPINNNLSNNSSSSHSSKGDGQENDHVTNNNYEFSYNDEMSVIHTNSESTKLSDTFDNNRAHHHQHSHSQLIRSTSPHNSSNSSVSSQQAHNIEDSDIAVTNNTSSPASPQSSYNSSFGSNSGRKLINSSNSSITALVPGGVVTTQNISTVIRPKENTNSLQFVKIQTPELSKKAVEQIRIAEATKMSKNKIKEVEEEWQNNLLNWKSKRRQQFSHTIDHEPSSQFETSGTGGGRKIKTFAEMIEERANSGRNRLGFNLQRYIGDQDEEDSPLSSGLDQKEGYLNELEQSKSKAQSDCEAQSSTSSSYNQPNSKSPHSPVDIPLEAVKIADDSPKVLSSQSVKCDSVSSHLQGKDEIDNVCRQHSISLTTLTETDQLNSTLKQGIRPSQIIPNYEEVNYDDGNSELSPRVESSREKVFKNNFVIDDINEKNSDEEEDEQEEEEQEEQRQLQRIAFEAKLKAFERLAKSPVVEAPKLPKRIIKPPVAQNVLKRQELIHNFREQEQPALPPKLKDLPPPPPPPPPPPLHVGKEFAPIEPLTIESKIMPPPVMSTLPRAGVKVVDVPASNIPNQKGAELPLPRMNESSGQISADVVVNKTEIPNRRSDFPVPSKIPAQGSDNPAQISDIPIQRSMSVLNKDSNVVTQHSNNSLQSLPDTTKLLPKFRNGFNSQIDTVQKLRNISAAPQLMPELPKNIPSPRKSTLREDKDRTVLSVSGKKRCSSCKEELGRGAAAFVVESLSLVYHTNCFRCSVCHVNLSNGFRGVDVRVHAEALHCQNCYSKDGLNYSRV